MSQNPSVGYHYPVPASTNVLPQIQVAPKPAVELVTTEIPTTTSSPITTTNPSPVSTMRPKVQQIPASLVKKPATTVVLAQVGNKI